MMTVSMDTPVGMAAWMLDHDADSHEKISRAFLDGQPSEALRQRDRGQHDVVQADEHRDLVGTAVLGGEPSSASLERVRAEAPELWLPVAFTSRSCSLKRCEPDSGHSASAGLVVSSTAQTGTDIRPSTSAFRKRNWQPPSTHRGDALARSGDGCIARRAVGDDPGTGRLLGHGLRLAQFRRALRCYSSSGKQTGTTCTALSLLWPGASNRIDPIPSRARLLTRRRHPGSGCRERADRLELGREGIPTFGRQWMDVGCCEVPVSRRSTPSRPSWALPRPGAPAPLDSPDFS
jgi:hypothetical protein